MQSLESGADTEVHCDEEEQQQLPVHSLSDSIGIGNESWNDSSHDTRSLASNHDRDASSSSSSSSSFYSESVSSSEDSFSSTSTSVSSFHAARQTPSPSVFFPSFRHRRQRLRQQPRQQEEEEEGQFINHNISANRRYRNRKNYSQHSTNSFFNGWFQCWRRKTSSSLQRHSYMSHKIHTSSWIRPLKLAVILAIILLLSVDKCTFYHDCNTVSDDHNIEAKIKIINNARHEIIKPSSMQKIGNQDRRNDQLGRPHHELSRRKQKESSANIVEEDDTCELPLWQQRSYPNCNLLHELDIKEYLFPHSRTPKPEQRKRQAAKPIEAYIASGLWRDVFRIDDESIIGRQHSSRSTPLGNTTSSTPSLTTTVLKLLKMEHPVDDRNLDRHRREALVMEHLTADPYILNLHAYCGNTLWIQDAQGGRVEEQIKVNIDSSLPLDEQHEDAMFSQRNQSLPQPQPQSQSLGANSHHGSSHNDFGNTTVIKEDFGSGPSLKQRTEWAFQSARAVAALHRANVLHADLQTSQFLLNKKGQIQLNDFNRCRFLPQNTSMTTKNKETPPVISNVTTTNICPVRIPTAPGTWRSPEEYKLRGLTAAADVYSLGNVLFHIFVGYKAYEEIGSIGGKVGGGKRQSIWRVQKEARERGELPMWPIDTPEQIQKVVNACLNLYPEKRPTAAEVALSLQEILVSGKFNESIGSDENL